MKLPNRFQKLAIMAITLLAFLLRAYRLGYQSYWIDEAWTVYFANLPMAELWHLLQTTEIVPPLYHSSNVFWIKLFGDGEYGLRFHSLVFGVMAIPFTYRLGQALMDDRLGLVAALLMAVAPYQIWHSQEARMYAILTAASAMSMWGFVEIWQRGGWRSWLIYIAGTEWSLLIHYHGAVLIGIQGLFLLLTWRRHRHGYWRWGLVLLLIFLSHLPWLSFSANQLQDYRGWVEQPALWEAFVRSAIAYSLNELVPRPQAIPLALIFVTVYGLGLIYASLRRWGRWQGWEMLAFLVAFTLIPPLAAWVYGEIRMAVYLERYLIPVQIGYLLAVAAGVVGILDFPTGELRTRFWILDFPLVSTRALWVAHLAGGVVLSVLLGISGWVLYHHYTDPLYAKPDWRAVVRKIEAFGQPGDAILLTGDGGENAFSFYYRGDLPVYADFNLLPPTHPDYKKGRKGLAELEQIMQKITAGRERLWYTPYGVEIDAAIADWLARQAYPAWHAWLGRKQLALYSTRTAPLGRLAKPPDQEKPVPLNFGEALTLAEVALPAEPVPAGDLLPLHLIWQTGTTLDQDYQLSLRLINRQGDVFTQSDWPPLASGGGPTSTWPVQRPVSDRRSLWLPPETPPGDYLLQFVLYSPATGQPLGEPVVLEGVTVQAAETVVPVEALAIPNFIPPAQRPEDQNPVVIGYALPEEIQPGQELWLWLYWQAGAGPVPESTLRLTLSSGSEHLDNEYPLADSAGSLATWQPGQVRRAIYHLSTSPRLAGEMAQLDLALISPAGEISQKMLAKVHLATRDRTFELPSPAHPTEIAFGRSPQLTLLGYEITAGGLAPGGTLEFTLYWRGEAEMATNYTVFTQLLDPAGQVVAQLDLPPQAGAAPTTTWLPGEIVTDPYRLSLPAGLPSGDYRLITGMYNPATGERLPVVSGGDFVGLGEVSIK